uniref:SJCHGC02990 protein n=1 Tax=Schistosoma japonicum TaxID=6182 RepID=Q5BT15_SCHJA|nr:SJCHGC02990 protein [Schistosoma japonicum]
MWETETSIKVAGEMKRYNLEILGISEINWLQAGQQRLASGEVPLYTGHEDENVSHKEWH